MRNNRSTLQLSAMGATWKLSFSIIFVVFTTARAQKYTICTPPESYSACEQLNRSIDITCLVRKNPVNCLLMVENGEAAFTSVSAEEAFLASSLTNNLVVLAEFVSKPSISHMDAADFETVILMKNELATEQTSLKGAKFCHPGIDGNKISPFILKEFEMQTLLQNNIDICPSDQSKTLTEYYISALNDFFGPSCRPGRWTIVNRTIDDEFKQKYSKLLELCRTTAYYDNHQYPFLQSLNCLLNDEGDLALTTMNTIIAYNETQPGVLNNYTFLCKNGKRIGAGVGSCVWTRQPWPLLVGNKNLVADLPIELRNWFVMNPLESSVLQLPAKYIDILKDIIFARYSTINITYDTPNLATYISGFRERPSSESSRLCKSSVSLCVISAEEEQKCKWLQQAALNYGIQPVIDCVSKESNVECLKALKNKVADVAVTDSNVTYTLNRHNLSIIAFGEESSEYMRRTVLVVNTTTVRRLEDLEGKSGFFSEYGDIAWLAFADTLRRRLWNDTEYYGQRLSKFLGNSCMPGVRDSFREPYQVDIAFDKLCALCRNDSTNSSVGISCSADPSNLCYGSNGALQCLRLTGDFAVITLNKDGITLPSNTSIMCKNGTLVANPSKVDDDCALSVTINDQVVVRKSDSKNKDIELMLQEFDDRFAVQTHTAFKVFDVFARGYNLIFKNTTMGMEIASFSPNKYAKGQLELFANIPNPKTSGNIQNPGGDSATSTLTSVVLVFSSLLVVLLN